MGKGSGVVTSIVVALVTAVVWVGSLAWELYAVGMTTKRNKQTQQFPILHLDHLCF